MQDENHNFIYIYLYKLYYIRLYLSLKKKFKLIGDLEFPYVVPYMLICCKKQF